MNCAKSLSLVARKCSAPSLERLESRIAPATFTVTNTNDSGAGSLRQAILNANADEFADAIVFDAGSIVAISPSSALPAITHPVFIDGYSVAGSRMNTSETGWNGEIDVQINGANAPAGTNGLTINGGSVTIRGLAIVGFKGDGIVFANVANNDFNKVEGCFIGVSAIGFPIPNEGDGIVVFANSNNDTIGGPTVSQRNIIAANGGDGIVLASDQNIVQGNVIGAFDLNPGSANYGNGGHGVNITGFNNNTIGGLNAHDGNRIAQNGGAGVRIATGNGNLIAGNAIAGNVGLGIDLGSLGVSLNDATDADTGGNTLLNYPIIKSAFTGTAGTRVEVDYVTQPFTQLRLEFFTSAAGDALGFGEGDRFLTRVVVTSDAAGVVKFTQVLDAIDTAGRVLTATATTVNTKNTSEFSPAFTLQAASPSLKITNGKTATFLDGDGDLVTLKVTKGTLTEGLFTFAPTGFTTEGAQLALLNLTDPLFAAANITITAKRGVTGDGVVNVGRIDATNVNLGKVTLAGDLGEIDAGHGDAGKSGLGALAANSLGLFSSAAQISAVNGNLGSLKVKTNIAGASVSVTGSIGSVTVGGSLVGDNTATTGNLVASLKIGSVRITGDLQFARIIAGGDAAATTAAKAMAITSVAIGGDAIQSSILGGYDVNGPTNTKAQIGTVRVKGNWDRCVLAAGVTAGGDGKFGTADDARIAAGASVASRIASIVIGGQVFATYGGNDHYGFVANSIGAMKVGVVAYKLNKTALDDVLIGPTNDVRLHEVA